MILVVIGCIVMAYVDAIVKPDYAVKSAVKIIIFTMLPLVYSLINKETALWNILRFNRKSIKLAVFLGIAVYAFILGAYFLLSPFFDFSKVNTLY